MSCFSRGFVGLTHHGFASSMLRAQSTSDALWRTGESQASSALRIWTYRLGSITSARTFSISSPMRAKKPSRKGAFYEKRPPTASNPSRPPTPEPSARSSLSKAKAPPLRSAAPTPRSVPTSSTPRPAPAIPNIPSNAATTFAEQLGRRTTPTLLYEAPRHTWFRIATLIFGSTCISYGVINYWTVYLNPPEGLMWWVPYVFGLICVCMAALGAYFLKGTHGIIRSIQAIPSSHIKELGGKSAMTQVARALERAGLTAPPPVFLELKVERMVPILSARKRYVLPSSVVLPLRITSFGLGGENAAAGALGGTPLPPSSTPERVIAQRAEQERLKKEREYEMDHLMTAPFRHAGKGAQTVWKQIGRSFTREGFVQVRENGKSHKMDVIGGWALENGRALDRLVTISEI